MKKRADELKETVDNILTDNNKKLDEIENSVLNDLVAQQIETEDYMKYLEKLISDYESKISCIKHTELMDFYIEFSLASLKMPNKNKPKLPIYTPCILQKGEIAKYFGEIEVNSLERFKLSSVTKVNDVTIQGNNIYHLSPLPPNKFWTGDGLGNLIQYDMEGNILQKISTITWNTIGNHTVMSKGELLYTDNSKNTVNRVTSDTFINKLIQTRSWEPGAIYSSPINGHI
ncbi:uncharacterized protein LOC134249344 [Saccostrea cucullata]